MLLAALELCSEAVAIYSASESRGNGSQLVWSNEAFNHLADQIGQGADAAQVLLNQLRRPANGGESTTRQAALEQAIDHPVLGSLQVTTKPVEGDSSGCQVLVARRQPARGETALAGFSRDVVTDLPDRRSLEQELQRRFRDSAQPFALFFIDLDGFKQVNDSQGHVAGDRILREIAQRFHQALRDHDFVARYGGDEFVVLIDGVDYELAAVPILRRLEAAAAQPLGAEWQGPGRTVQLSASIGVALSSEGYSTPEAMLHAADRGMYAHKRAGQ